MALVALVFGSLLWATGLLRASLALPSELAERLVCAVRLSSGCRSEPKLVGAYGADVAARMRAHAPTILYEDGMSALPVDYRRCREDACAAGAGEGHVTRSDADEPVVAFTHAVDCRSDSAAASEAAGADCSDERAGNLYLQYWFYYPGSASGEGSTPLRGAIRGATAALGKPSYHPDDWESLQIRIAPDGRRFARASSHKGYNGWGPDVGTLYVSGGSHAGNARVNREQARVTRAHRLRLIPLRAIAQHDGTAFAVTPPWRKRVFVDPESSGTD